ncbi:hypothetical protein [Streptomyces sp. CAU 1734]|uniref:hypothetical protein n=1 Tax=Streptomyces sp. CAU 1734 TaxID=3140360 RepID=UPI00325FF52F
MKIQTRAAVHPFPARMAPELVERKIATLSSNAVVLDPMMGSGTFPLAANLSGHTAFGCDTDPLALMITQTVGTDYDLSSFTEHAREIAVRASKLKNANIQVDSETSKFIDFWFDSETRSRLSALAAEITLAPEKLKAPLWCAFSRLIITKDSGASKARDVSHSRPHRVRDAASFDPIDRFCVSAETVATRVRTLRDSYSAASSKAKLTMLRADARSLPLCSSSVDAVMTSPPYLVAIDYLRGHRMSLVWMGYSISYLRGLRSTNVGSEVGMRAASEIEEIAKSSTPPGISSRAAGIVYKYVSDMDSVFSEISRVLKPGGTAAFVIADAKINGFDVSIDRILQGLGRRHEFELRDRHARELPESRRYLPPPRGGTNSLDKRMKEEVVLTFAS